MIHVISDIYTFSLITHEGQSGHGENRIQITPEGVKKI